MMLGHEEDTTIDDLAAPTGATKPAVDLRAFRETVVLFAMAAIVIALAVLVWPAGSRVPFIVLSVMLVAAGGRIVIRSSNRPRLRVLAKGLAILAAGVVVLLASWASSPVAEQLLEIVVNVTAVATAALSAIIIVSAVDTHSKRVTGYRDAFEVTAAWLAAMPRSEAIRGDLYKQILYEGPFGSRMVKRFLILMSLASAIAALGVIADSTVAVLAGMLIAPLMLPMMGMAACIVEGWPRRLLRLGAITSAGIAVTVAVALLLGFIEPGVIDTAANTQIASRAVPTIRDLTIALAAGAAGAYALSRPDVSNSLPGAAVAISLVPPLTVVGVALSQGDVDSATGALLLFSTNTLAILVMGGIVFILTGIVPVRRSTITRRHLRLWLTVGSAGFAVAAALFLNGAELQSGGSEVAAIEAAVHDWLDDSGHYPYDIDVDGDKVIVVGIGPDSDLPDTAELASGLGEQLGRTFIVDALFLVGESSTATTN